MRLPGTASVSGESKTVRDGRYSHMATAVEPLPVCVRVDVACGKLHIVYIDMTYACLYIRSGLFAIRHACCQKVDRCRLSRRCVLIEAEGII